MATAPPAPSGPVGARTPGASGRVRSWSQFSQWRRCGKEFQLSRLRRVPRRPGVWFPAGTAVHATIEQYLRQQMERGSNA